MLSQDMHRRGPLRRPRRARPRPIALPWSLDVFCASVAIFALALLPMLGSISALLFLLSGMGLIVTGPDAVYRALRREWLIVAMVTWCVISFVWSDYPSITLRHAIQLALTVLISLAIFQRIPARTFLKIVLGAMLAAGILSLASGNTRADGLGYLGIYASKNALASSMGLLCLIALAVLFDRRMGGGWRFLALIGAGLGMLLLIMGQSAGALVAIILSVGAIGPILLLQRLAPLARLVVIVLVTVLIAALGVMLSTMADTLSTMFLNLTGKDVTLTGRTDLWMIAFDEIAARPFLGAGFQAVWVHGNPLAEQLWDRFGIAARSGFHFHNTLISNAVEIGLIGIALQIAVLMVTVWLTLSWTIRLRTAASLFFGIFIVRQVLTMGIEVVFFAQFDLITILMVGALYYARSYRLQNPLPQVGRPGPRPMRGRMVTVRAVPVSPAPGKSASVAAMPPKAQPGRGAPGTGSRIGH